MVVHGGVMWYRGVHGHGGVMWYRVVQGGTW